MKSRGIELQGIVYAGLMIDNGEPSVVEFNMRFGDPETQVVLSRLKTDLISVFQAMVNKTLHSVTLDWENDASVCVVMASEGYPQSYPKGLVINGLDEFNNENGTSIIHAGTKVDGNSIVTNGGRVLGVVSKGETVKAAQDAVYDAVKKIHFDGAHYRTDIAAKAIS